MCRNFVFLLLMLTGLQHPAASAEKSFKERTVLRRPVALAVAGDLLYSANRRSGTVSIFDRRKRSVIEEVKIGTQLADLKSISHGSFLLAVDEAEHELILLDRDGRQLNVVQRLPVAYSPVSISVSENGEFCSVASLWAGRVTLVALAKTGSGLRLQTLKVIDLPFAPREQHLVQNDTRLVLADSHGGRLAVVDTQKRELLSVISFSGHNIRGLATSRDGSELLVTHQLLNENSTTTRDLVFWGGLMSNMLRSITFEELLRTDVKNSKQQPVQERRLAHWSFYPFGRPGSATGDPSKILITKKGMAIVSLSGVNEVAVRTSPTQTFLRRSVGRRPTAVVTDPEEEFAYVANTFDDSISVLELAELKVVETIPLGPRAEPTLADRGEMLFYDARFSLDGWYSCHSCHTDGHTTGLLNDNLSDGYFGHPKRILSLLGTGQTGPWAWNGSKADLATQIRASMRSTMQGNPEMVSKENVEALVAFLHGLQPAPSIARARGLKDTAALLRGKQFFEKQGCIECHQPPRYTSAEIYDVGLGEKSGTKEFNPPSLLGVSQRGPFFHDNRAESLEEVFTRYRHGESDELSAKELADLLAFLRSL